MKQLKYLGQILLAIQAAIANYPKVIVFFQLKYPPGMKKYAFW